MSSPPAHSPIIPSSLNLPKKRPSLGPHIPPPNPKRRKPSTGPSQLRQTSFPPEDAPSPYAARSPSVESSIIGSVVGGKGKRRKGGAGSAAGGGDDARSTITTGKAGTDKDGPEDGAEEEDEGGEVLAVLEGGKVDEASQKRERENLRMLVEAFTPDQLTRYETWRRVKLKKETVRRITNQTLSQSVPPSVITTINGYTKLFIGELIDRARQVQTEWMAVATEWAVPYDLVKHGPKAGAGPGINGAAATPGAYPQNGTAVYPQSVPQPPKAYIMEPIPPGTPLSEKLKDEHRGPLAPDHLREALRRYKKDREGGGAGFMGLSLEGRENTAVRMGGRKLFR